uniref:Clathrin heavy chain 1-like n=1 Tax=Saccoglossus kowalevskii TaxID=10224 RepID=A0ABM0MFN7_SACKO|nr:PREDICTED: clathrin heavy chain 1-like [Saccoglossus kowalevskii]
MARSYSGGGSGDNQVLALVQMRTVTQLRNYEIQPEQINVQKVAMTSSMWVCCCHDTRRKRHKRLVTIVNINSKEPHARSWPTIADSAAMNPTNPLIALKGGKTIEVFDLPRRKLIHRCTMDDPIAYSSWISSEVIVIVTTSIVYHWNITAVESEPCRVFQRHGRLKHCQLVKYKIDKKMKWMALTGLYMEVK